MILDRKKQIYKPNKLSNKNDLASIIDHCKHSLLTEIQAKPLTASVAKVYIAQRILALESLHSKDIVYRNLSLDNI